MFVCFSRRLSLRPSQEELEQKNILHSKLILKSESYISMPPYKCEIERLIFSYRVLKRTISMEWYIVENVGTGLSSTSVVELRYT